MSTPKEIFITINDLPEKKVEIINDQSALIDSKEVEYTLNKDGHLHLIRVGGINYEIEIVDRNGSQVDVKINGKKATLKISSRLDKLLEDLGMDVGEDLIAQNIQAPMPGKILKLYPSTGSEVSEGDPLLILEAMKMENIIKSPRSGIISSIEVSEGESVEKNQNLLTFE